MGRLWVYLILFAGAQPMSNFIHRLSLYLDLIFIFIVDAWHRRGLGGGVIVPRTLSPMRVIVIPLAKRLLFKLVTP